MLGISATAFFCEDVRREISGRQTLIGVMADSVRVRDFPTDLRRLTVYYRIRLEPQWKNAGLEVIPFLEVDGQPFDHQVEPVPANMLENALDRARALNLPFATLSGRVLMKEPVHFEKPCRVLAKLRVGSEVLLCSYLTVTDKPTAELISDARESSAPASE